MGNIDFAAFKAERAKYANRAIPGQALQAYRRLKWQASLTAWKEQIGARSFYADSDNIAHKYTDSRGLFYVFKIESDYDYSCDFAFQQWERESRDYIPNRERGEYNRHSGHGLNVCRDFWESRGDMRAHYDVFSISEKELQTFRKSRLGRHASYVQMLKDAKAVLDSDLEAVGLDYCGATVEVYESEDAFDNDESPIAENSLWACDSDYCTSGEVFYEQVFPEAERAALDWLATRHAMIAREMEAARPDMYANA